MTASFFRKLPGLAISLLFVAGAAVAQTSQIEGTVKGEDGQPVKDALIKIERQDVKGTYQVKTHKKGDYLHAGLPLGTYNVSVLIDGKERDTVRGIRTRMGDTTTVDFDLQKQAQRSASIAKAAENGTLSQDQARDMSPEQKAAIEKQMKERSAAMQKNKALNDAFNAGMEAMKTKNYDAAAEQFAKAGELDPKQHVIWGQLAEAYMGEAKTKTGADSEAALNKALETYPKALELLPADASYHNNYALALAKAKKFDQMEVEIKKAIELDPPGAGKYYFNLGAVLTNNGQVGPACDAFKSAITADPNYADAHYQYGICLTSKATNKPDGTIVYPDGTAEAFQKYLELKPDGPNAESAKALLSTMGAKLETSYTAPGAEKKKPAAPAKKK